MLRMSFQAKGVVRLGQDCMELGSGFGFSAYQAESLEGRLRKRANVTDLTVPVKIPRIGYDRGDE